MKKILLSLLTGMAALAGTASAEISVSGTLDATSHYIFRGTTLAQSAIQAGAEVSSESGLYGGLWYSTPLENSDAFAVEADFYGGYSFAAGETVTADIGVTRYDYETGYGDSTEVYGGLSFDYAIEPSIYLYYDMDYEVFTVEGSAGHSWAAGPNSSFDVGVSLGHVEPDAGTDWSYGTVSAAYSATLSEGIGGYVSLTYAASSEDTLLDDFDAGTYDSDGFAFGVGLTFE